MLDAIYPPDVKYEYSKAHVLPYLTAIINETLRLQPPVTAGMPRETPPQGITIGGVYFPGKLVIKVPTFSIQRDERYWESPLDFIPDRWTDMPELIKDKRAFNPFSAGNS